MKRILIGLCVLIGALPASAQKPTPDRTAMYEDVEVLRRLLADAVQARSNASDLRSIYYGYPTTWSTDASNSVWAPELLGNARYIKRADGIVTWVDGGTDLTGVRSLIMAPYVDQGQTYPMWANYFVQGNQRPAVSPATTDGTYLKGVGPIFTVTMDQAEVASLPLPRKGPALAANCAHCHGTTMNAKTEAPVETKAAPVDPWERKLRQVRGEPEPKAPARPAARITHEEICGPGRLAELALEALTKYGPRFRELGTSERLSVAFTIRPAPKATTAESLEPGAKAKQSADEQLAAGDLHAKQGKREDAIKAYQSAIESLSKPLGFSKDASYEPVRQAIEESTKTIRSAHGKLAQLLLEANKLDEAKAAIEQAKSASVRLETIAKPTPVPEKPPLPIKLTVTLTKKALEVATDVASLRPESATALRAAAEIEAVGFGKGK